MSQARYQNGSIVLDKKQTLGCFAGAKKPKAASSGVL